jgi:MFS family permease
MAARLDRTFASLRVRNYRNFFIGQIVSWTGTWVQWVAQGWLVLQITHSGFGLGLITALQWLPVLLFGAWAGVLADRFEKRKLLIFTNVAGGIFSLGLGIATVTHVVNLGIVVVAALLLGVVTALDNPTRQTFTMEMVGRDNLTNAVSLNTATFTTARVLGPGAAGFLIAGVGIGPCFLVNAVSFLPIIAVLVFMNKGELTVAENVERGKGQVREGLRYAASVPVLRTLLTMMAVVGTLQYNFQVILPVLAKETFSGDARTLGLMGAVLGVGMFCGSIGTAAFGKSTRKTLIYSGFALGLVTLLVAVSPTVWIAAAVMIPLGAASMVFLTTINATLQLTSSDSMRGRVMAIYFVLFLGSTPIGAPIVGWVAETFNARASLALGGFATIGACIYGYIRFVQIKRDDEASLAAIEGDEGRLGEPVTEREEIAARPGW